MNEDKIKFQSKSEIANAIQVLTPFAELDVSGNPIFPFALEKIKELTKLL